MASNGSLSTSQSFSHAISYLEEVLSIKEAAYSNWTSVEPLEEILVGKLLNRLFLLTDPHLAPENIIKILLDKAELTRAIESCNYITWLAHRTNLNLADTDPALSPSCLHQVPQYCHISSIVFDLERPLPLSSLLPLASSVSIRRLHISVTRDEVSSPPNATLEQLRPLFDGLLDFGLCLPDSCEFLEVTHFLNLLDLQKVQSICIHARQPLPWSIIGSFKRLEHLTASTASPNPSEASDMIICAKSLPLLKQLQLCIPKGRLHIVCKSLGFTSHITGLKSSCVLTSPGTTLDVDSCIRFLTLHVEEKIGTKANVKSFLISLSDLDLRHRLILSLLRRALFDASALFGILDILLNENNLWKASFKGEVVPLISRAFTLYASRLPLSSADKLRSVDTDYLTKELAYLSLNKGTKGWKAQTSPLEVMLRICELVWLIGKEVEYENRSLASRNQIAEELGRLARENLQSSIEHLIAFISGNLQLVDVDWVANASLLKFICLLQWAVGLETPNFQFSFHRSTAIVKFLAGPWSSKLGKIQYRDLIVKPLWLLRYDEAMCKSLLAHGFWDEVALLTRVYSPTSCGIPLTRGSSTDLDLVEDMELVPLTVTDLSILRFVAATLAHAPTHEDQNNAEIIRNIIIILSSSDSTDLDEMISPWIKTTPTSGSCPLSQHLHIIFSSFQRKPARCTHLCQLFASHCGECRAILLPDFSTTQGFSTTPTSSPYPFPYKIRSAANMLKWLEQEHEALALISPWVASVDVLEAKSYLSIFQREHSLPSELRALSPSQMLRLMCEKFYEDLVVDVDDLQPFTTLQDPSRLHYYISHFLTPLLPCSIAAEYFLEVGIVDLLSKLVFDLGCLVSCLDAIGSLIQHQFVSQVFLKKMVKLSVLDHQHEVIQIAGSFLGRSRYEDCCFYPRRISTDTHVPFRLIQPVLLTGTSLDSEEQAQQDIASLLLESLLYLVSISWPPPLDADRLNESSFPRVLTESDHKTVHKNLKIVTSACTLATQIISISAPHMDTWRASAQHFVTPLLERLLSSLPCPRGDINRSIKAKALKSVQHLIKATYADLKEPYDLLPVTIRYNMYHRN